MRPERHLSITPPRHRLRARYRLEPGEEGPAQARAIVDRELRFHVALPVLEQLELMVSELVTAALAARPAEIVVDIELDARVRCRVTTSAPSPPSGRRQGRWALATVAGLACRWGLSHAAGATSVWFEGPRR